jgi:tripartite-type tricarboxylate transporter receptor subunit TctC
MAQNYPEQVVRIVNPFPPGGSVDVTGRILAQKLSENLGHQFILENRAGAGGNIGAESVAKSTPDGYTLLYSTPGPLVVNHHLYAKGLPYDPVKDFEPIAVVVRVPMVLLAHPSLPATNVQELIELAKRKPGTINFGSPGIGSANHLMGELFKSMAKVELTHVPYKGSGPAMADLLGGHIQLMFDAIPANLQNITTGAVRALANGGSRRPATLANVPTIIEQGLAGFDSFSWFALVAPAKTPAPIMTRLRAETAKILVTPEVTKRLIELGTEPGTATESEVRAFFGSETDKWSEVIRVAKIRIE